MQRRSASEKSRRYLIEAIVKSEANCGVPGRFLRGWQMGARRAELGHGS
jgi:hypothetical protein